MVRELIKQDINFLEHPLWFQDKHFADGLEEGYIWKDFNGFVYRAHYKPPVKTDQLFLFCLLYKSQQNEWTETLDTSKYEILKGCGMAPNNERYKRIEESLKRWMAVTIEFNGKFYDGENYQTLNFGIIDYWSISEKTKRLTVRFSPEWLSTIRYSQFFKFLDFEQIKQLRSPLATRIHEILVKTFHGRDSWQIDSLKLAKKIPMKEKHPAHIIPKVRSALKRINERTELKIELEIKKPERGKALLIFRKRLEIETVREEISTSLKIETDELRELISCLPKKEREKKTIKRGIESALKKKGNDYVRRNILYSNEHSKKNYRTYLLKALKEDWGSTWWEERKEEQQHISFENKVKEQELDTLQNQTMEELEFYSQEFLSLRSQEEFEAVYSHVHEKTKSEISESSEQFEYLKSVRLLSLLKSGVNRYQNQIQ